MGGISWDYVVGDVHGCIDTLRALEERIGRHAARHGVRARVVSTGDLIDRGPGSRAVVEHLRQGVRAGTHAVVPGNHDVLMLECVRAFGPWPDGLEWPAHLYTIEDYHRRGHRAARWLSAWDHAHYRRMLWLSQGGYQTLVSYGADPERPESWEIEREHLEFLLGLPVIWEGGEGGDRGEAKGDKGEGRGVGRGVVVSHALATREDLDTLRAAGEGEGRRRLRPAGGRMETDDGAGGAPSERAELQAACSRLIWNRELPGEAPDPERVHVSGHTPLGRVRRHRGLRLVQVDTGCCFGGRLSAWCAQTDEAMSVRLRDAVDG